MVGRSGLFGKVNLLDALIFFHMVDVDSMYYIVKILMNMDYIFKPSQHLENVLPKLII